MTNRSWILSWFSLFSSVGTLLCCALPSLLVFLGFGATFAGMVSFFPQIVWLSKYKEIVFGFSFLLILFGFVFHFLNQNMACPIDPLQARVCRSTRTWSFGILVFSSLLWVTGALFAFVAPVFLV